MLVAQTSEWGTSGSGTELPRDRQEHSRAPLDVRERHPLDRGVRALAARAEDDRRDEALRDQRGVRPERGADGLGRAGVAADEADDLLRPRDLERVPRGDDAPRAPE